MTVSVGRTDILDSPQEPIEDGTLGGHVMPAPTRHAPMGAFETLQQIDRFCREVYHRIFGPEEGERRYKNLRFVDAVALWQEGLSHSCDPRVLH